MSRTPALAVILLASAVAVLLVTFKDREEVPPRRTSTAVRGVPRGTTKSTGKRKVKRVVKKKAKRRSR